MEWKQKEDPEVAHCLEETKNELEYWETLYPDRPARVQILGGRPCLMMPYGVEIETAQERIDHVEAVRKELERFAKQHQLCYAKSNIRWKHVLCDFRGKLFSLIFDPW